MYFLIILQNYMTVSKFVSFDNQSPWPTAAAVAHGGLANVVAHGGCRKPTAAGSHLATAVRHGSCMWPTFVGHGGCFF
jgi:hypothetical protein